MSNFKEKKWLIVGGVAATAVLALSAGRLIRIFTSGGDSFYSLCSKITKEIARKGKEKNSEVCHFYRLIKSKTLSSDFLVQLLELPPKKEREKAINRDVFLPPFEAGIFIMNFGSTHRLLFNKNMVLPEHVLVVTTESEPQYAEVSEGDFYYGFLTLSAINGLCFYNSDRTAGSSQLHKHLQVVSLNSLKTQILEALDEAAGEAKPAVEGYSQDSAVEIPQFEGYKVACVRLRAFDPNANLKKQAQYLKQVYHSLKAKLDADGQEKSFNLLFTKDWMLVALRKQENLFGASFNALSVAGSLLAKDSMMFQTLESKSAKEIFDEILVQEHDTLTYPFDKKY